MRAPCFWHCSLQASVWIDWSDPTFCNARFRWLLNWDADGGTESFYRSAAEGLLLQAVAPLLAGDSTLPCKLQRLLASAKNLGDPGVAEGKQTYPDYSGIAPPAHENVEKDRVHLMVSLTILHCAAWHCESPARCWQSHRHLGWN